MKKRSGSRFILGHLRLTEIAELGVGEETVILLNHEEPNAVALASAALKSVFSRAKKRCELSSQRILVHVGDGVWKQSAYLTVKVVPPHVMAKSDDPFGDDNR